MKIIFDKIQEDGQGSFFVQKKISGENCFHFLTQVEDKITLKTTLQKHLNDVKIKDKAMSDIETEINNVIMTLV